MKLPSEMTEREYFACIGRRPGMFVGTISFHTLTAFLAGYDQHTIRHGGDGPHRLGRQCRANGVVGY
ncbi:hypothetical protein [Streptomyces asiaticus]